MIYEKQKGLKLRSCLTLRGLEAKTIWAHERSK